MSKVIPIKDDKPFQLEYIEYSDLGTSKFVKKDAEISDDIETFESAGLLLDKRLIVVDIDNGISQGILEKIFDTFNCRTMYTITDRGFHLYYKKKPYCRKRNTEAYCPLGFKIEYKIYYDNVPSVCERREGKTREMIENEIIELPDVFEDINTKELVDPHGLDDGDGRNNVLFALKNLLFRKKFTVDEIRIYIDFINNNLFASPMEDIEKYLKQGEAFENRDRGPIELAYEVMTRFDTKYYKDKIRFKDKNGKQYLTDDSMLQHYISTEYSWLLSKDINEIMTQIKMKSTRVRETSFPINLNNGHITNEGKFEPVCYDGFTPFYIDIDYDANAEEDETVEQLLTHFSNGDETFRKFIIQMCAYPLIYDYDFKRRNATIFFIVGDGNNGKGTLFQFLTSVFTSANTAHKTVEDLTDNHQLMGCDNKLVNLGDDIEDGVIKERHMKVLKSISTADTISVRGLYKEATDNVIAPTLIFTTNHMLKSFEKGNSWVRRPKWIPVYNEVKVKDKDFLKKLRSDKARKYMFKLMIEELEELYEDGLIDCEVINDFTKNYHILNNNIIAFLELEEYQKEEYIDTKPVVLYEKYKLWCIEEGEHPLSLKSFRTTVKTIWGYDVRPIWDNVLSQTIRAFVDIEKGDN